MPPRRRGPGRPRREPSPEIFHEEEVEMEHHPPEEVEQEMPPPPPPMPDYQQALQMFTQTIREMRQEPAPRDREITIRQIREHGATTFEGMKNPLEAESWMQRLERAYEVLEVPDDQKVRFATYLLDGAAYTWWLSVRARQDPPVTAWNAFKELFYRQYFPANYRDARVQEFMSLKQGRMTVAEYEQRFLELSRFAPFIVADEYQRCRKFEYGLRESIRVSLLAASFTDFGNLVQAVEWIEESLNIRQSHRDHGPRRGRRQPF